jgi:hypothetical protein
MSNTLATHSTSDGDIVELYHGLTAQWIFDNRCLALSAEHTAPALVDAWANKIIEVASTWQPERTLYILNDFSGKNCVVTQYNQRKNRELIQMFPNMKSSTATVVRRNLTMQLSRIFIQTLPQNKNRQVYLTFTRQDALAWLKTQMELEDRIVR